VVDDSVRAACAGHLLFSPREPIAVKGKTGNIPIFHPYPPPPPSSSSSLPPPPQDTGDFTASGSRYGEGSHHDTHGAAASLVVPAPVLGGNLYRVMGRRQLEALGSLRMLSSLRGLVDRLPASAATAAPLVAPAPPGSPEAAQQVAQHLFGGTHTRTRLIFHEVIFFLSSLMISHPNILSLSNNRFLFHRFACVSVYHDCTIVPALNCTVAVP